MGDSCPACLRQHSYCEYLYDELDGFVMGASHAGVCTESSDGHAYALHFGQTILKVTMIGRHFDRHFTIRFPAILFILAMVCSKWSWVHPANANRYIPATEIGNTLHTVPVGQPQTCF